MEILDWNELVDSYVDGELSDEEARRVEERSRFDMALWSQIDWTRRLRRLFENSRRTFPKEYENRLQGALRNCDAWAAIDARRAQASSTTSTSSRRGRVKEFALIAASVAAVLGGIAFFSDATWRRDSGAFSERLLALNSTKDPASVQETASSFQDENFESSDTINVENEEETTLDAASEPLLSSASVPNASTDAEKFSEGSTSSDDRALLSSDGVSVGTVGSSPYDASAASGVTSYPMLESSQARALSGFSAHGTRLPGSFNRSGKALGDAFLSPEAPSMSIGEGAAFSPNSSLGARADEAGEFTLRRDACRLSQKEYWIKVSFAGSAELRAQMSEIGQICEEEGIRYFQSSGKGEARLVNVAPTQLRRLAERLGEGAARDVKVSRALQEWAQTPSNAPAKENLKDVLLVFHLQSEASEGSAEELDANASTTEEKAPVENAPGVEGESL